MVAWLRDAQIRDAQIRDAQIRDAQIRDEIRDALKVLRGQSGTKEVNGALRPIWP